ncbi:MAG: ComF family protein [Saprospiraceae bacterium]|nr:ComF family protein [Saprospiraceae bacterium]
MHDVLNYIRLLFDDICHTLYPDLCIACGKRPKTSNAIFCVDCLHKMPYTDHFSIKANKVTQHFWGRLPLDHGAAMLHFRQEGIVGNMIHKLKYKNRGETAHVLGGLAGTLLIHSPLFSLPDFIIPVPITNKKKIKRGYNQSVLFGRGVSEVTGIKLIEDILIKVTETDSQTGKSRTGRVENVSKTFNVVKRDTIKGRHILIVDDVVTTGATLEACGLKLLEAGVSKISLLTIAVAE